MHKCAAVTKSTKNVYQKVCVHVHCSVCVCVHCAQDFLWFSMKHSNGMEEADMSVHCSTLLHHFAQTAPIFSKSLFISYSHSTKCFTFVYSDSMMINHPCEKIKWFFAWKVKAFFFTFKKNNKCEYVNSCCSYAHCSVLILIVWAHTWATKSNLDSLPTLELTLESGKKSFSHS